METECVFSYETVEYRVAGIARRLPSETADGRSKGVVGLRRDEIGVTKLLREVRRCDDSLSLGSANRTGNHRN